MVRQQTDPHTPPAIDLALIAQRVLKLTEIATLDHIESLDRSQANALIVESSYSPGFSRDRREL